MLTLSLLIYLHHISSLALPLVFSILSLWSLWLIHTHCGDSPSEWHIHATQQHWWFKEFYKLYPSSLRTESTVSHSTPDISLQFLHPPCITSPPLCLYYLCIANSTIELSNWNCWSFRSLFHLDINWNLVVYLMCSILLLLTLMPLSSKVLLHVSNLLATSFLDSVHNTLLSMLSIFQEASYFTSFITTSITY